MPPSTIFDIEPLGFTPFQIRSPQNAPVNVPGPMDVSNFFRAQGVLQNRQALELRQKELDFRNSAFEYQVINDRLTQAEKMLTMLNNTDLSTDENVLGLDPSLERHARILDSVNSTYQEAIENIVGSLEGVDDNLSSAEFSQNILSQVANAQKTLNSPEIRRIAGNHRLYKEHLARVNQMFADGWGVDLSQAAAIRERYAAYANGEPGSETLPTNIFDDTQLYYDRKNLNKSLDNAVKEISTPTKKRILVTGEELKATGMVPANSDVHDQDVFEVEVEELPTRERASEILYTQYSTDPNFEKYIRSTLTVEGQPITPENIDAAKRKFLQNQVSGKISGQELFQGIYGNITDFQSLSKYPRKSSDSSTGNRFADNTESERLLNDIDNQITGIGYNKNSVSTFQIRDIEDVIQTDPRGFNAIEFDTESQPGKLIIKQKAREASIDSKGNEIPEQPERIIAIADKHKTAQEQLEANKFPEPKSEVVQNMVSGAEVTPTQVLSDAEKFGCQDDDLCGMIDQYKIVNQQIEALKEENLQREGQGLPLMNEEMENLLVQRRTIEEGLTSQSSRNAIFASVNPETARQAYEALAEDINDSIDLLEEGESLTVARDLIGGTGVLDVSGLTPSDEDVIFTRSQADPDVYWVQKDGVRQAIDKRDLPDWIGQNLKDLALEFNDAVGRVQQQQIPKIKIDNETGETIRAEEGDYDWYLGTSTPSNTPSVTPSATPSTQSSGFTNPLLSTGENTPEEIPEDVVESTPEESTAYDSIQTVVVPKIIGVESGGDARAKNPDSTATGAGQFIDSTWLEMMDKYKPSLIEGLTREEILDLRNDFELSKEMTTRYAEENAEAIENAGFDASYGNIYLAHFLGPKAAIKVLNADPDTPVEDLLTESAINSNKSILKGKTAQEVIDWAERKMK